MKTGRKHSKNINPSPLKLVDQGSGIPFQKKITFHDLDHLAGTWNSQDEEEFTSNTQPFENIDEESMTNVKK